MFRGLFNLFSPALGTPDEARRERQFPRPHSHGAAPRSLGAPKQQGRRGRPENRAAGGFRDADAGFLPMLRVRRRRPAGKWEMPRPRGPRARRGSSAAARRPKPTNRAAPAWALRPTEGGGDQRPWTSRDQNGPRAPPVPRKRTCRRPRGGRRRGPTGRARMGWRPRPTPCPSFSEGRRSRRRGRSGFLFHAAKDAELVGRACPRNLGEGPWSGTQLFWPLFTPTPEKEDPAGAGPPVMLAPPFGDIAHQHHTEANGRAWPLVPLWAKALRQIFP